MIKREAITCLVLAAALLPAGLAHAQLPSGTWQLQWADEFSLTQLDTMKWSYNYPWGSTHNHDAYMDPDNVILGDGTLTLRAQRVAQGGKPFTSGAVSTGYTKFTANGGYIEARIRLPDTPGSWPAFWGLYSGWPPEADIMEYPIDTAAGTGYAQDQYHTAFHYTNSSGGNSAGAGQVNPGSAGDLGGAYHNFGMKWVEDTSVAFFFDGAQVSSFNSGADVAEMVNMYLILNYAVGGWPGTPNTTEWPSGHTDEMKVDWVRVWEEAGTSTTNWAYSGTSEYVQWDTAANWSNGVPNLGGVTANFASVTPAEQRLDWSGIRTVSNLNFSGPTRYVVGFSDDRLLLVGSNNANGNASITVNNAAQNVPHEIRARVELWSTVAITNHTDQPLSVTGQLFGGGGVIVDGSGHVIVASSNLFTGATTVSGGTLRFSGSGSIAASSQYNIGNGAAVLQVDATGRLGDGLINITSTGGATGSTGRLELTGNASLANNITLAPRNDPGASDAIRNVSGNSILSGAITIVTGGSQSRIQSDAGQLTLSGAITTTATSARNLYLQGAGAGLVSGVIADNAANSAGKIDLAKQGAGTWTLSAANTYTGTTTISAGTLIVNGATGAGLTTVASGATLNGSGTIAGGLSASGNIAPGNSAGTLTVTGNAVFAADSTLTMEIGGATPGSQYDRFIISGQLTAGGNLNVALINGFLPGVGASFDLIDWSTRTGMFANLNLPSMANRGWDTSQLYVDGKISVVSTLPGDFNGNGLVDAADYVVWRKTGSLPTQYDVWRTHFGQSVGSGSLVGAAVPEPALLTLICAALISVAAIRHRSPRN